MEDSVPDGDVVVAFEDFTKEYDGTVAVDGLDLDVFAGEVFGFLGPNGAGKTTTIRTLLDLIRPTAGAIRVFGLDSRRDGPAIRARTGYLASDVALYPNLTGRRLLTMLAGIRGDVDAGYVDHLVGRLHAELERPIKDLSRGNKQKIGVIQAFMARPPLLVLDEPTRGLDPLVQDVVHELIRQARDEGRTVFLSSHNLPEVEEVCTRVGMIRKGRLVEVAPIDALRRRTVRHVDILFKHPVDAGAFVGLPGVVKAVGIGPRVRLTVDGPFDAVVKKAAEHEVVDVVSREPELEEIFRHYYEADDDA